MCFGEKQHSDLSCTPLNLPIHGYTGAESQLRAAPLHQRADFALVISTFHHITSWYDLRVWYININKKSSYFKLLVQQFNVIAV